jgi:hypothetical protein
MAIFCIGLIVFAEGAYLETRNPRSNAEDDVAWLVLGVGVTMIAIGASTPFAPLWAVALIGTASPFVAFGLAVVVVWSVIILNAIFHYL